VEIKEDYYFDDESTREDKLKVFDYWDGFCGYIVEKFRSGKKRYKVIHLYAEDDGHFWKIHTFHECWIDNLTTTLLKIKNN